MKEYPVKLTEFDQITSDISCPVCGFDNVHHNSVAFPLASNDDYRARQRVRGDVIVIPAHCEEGCKFNILLGFHKGFLRIWAEDRHSNPDNDPT